MASHQPPISACRAEAAGINSPQMQLQGAADFISEGLRTGDQDRIGFRDLSLSLLLLLLRKRMKKYRDTEEKIIKD